MLILQIVVNEVQGQLPLMIVVKVAGWLQIAFLAAEVISAAGSHIIGLAGASLGYALVI